MYFWENLLMLFKEMNFIDIKIVDFFNLFIYISNTCFTSCIIFKLSILNVNVWNVHSSFSKFTLICSLYNYTLYK